ncbi:phage tail terminator protein [Kingella potus]|nr:hypothetical protein [Kingella potus]UOP02016.1 hypothetical protein LVJ84_14275 [Kingella potus]
MAGKSLEAIMTPYADNILACYPALIERLAAVPGVKRVLEAPDLEALAADRRIRPDDGAVYLVFDGFTPAETAGNAANLALKLSFSVILAKRQYAPNKMQYGQDGAGETLTALIRAMQGFVPKNADGQSLAAAPFSARAALPITYDEGYAFFPLRFETSVVITMKRR